MRTKGNVRGSITVFLSMTLLIILSLVMTTVEALRVSSMSAYTNRALYTALDSVFADYYYPLFKEYHVFGLDGSYSSDSVQERIIQDKISEYMEYTFEPNKNIAFAGFNVPIKGFDMYGIKTEEVKVEEVHTLMDYDGGLFRSQAVDYTKYRLAGDGVEELLEKANLINNSGIKDIESTQIIISKKMTVEKEVSIITNDLVTLSRLLDGIVITKSGPKVNKNGSLYINNSFIKKMCNSLSTINNPYPENPWVSSALKTKLINPTSLINKGISCLDSLIENNKTRANTQSEEVIEECNNKEKQLIKDFKINLSEIKSLINSTDNLTKSALSVTTRLNNKQAKLTKEINKYESTLKSMENNISDELYSSFWNDYEELEKYRNDTSNKKGHYDFLKMKNTLLDNQVILQEIKGEFNITINNNESSWLQGKEKLARIRKLVSKYSHDNLQLDYSSLAKKEEGPDYFLEINSLISGDIISLLLPDPKETSDKNIKNINRGNLPSSQYKNLDKGSSNISNELSELGLTDSFTVLTDMLDNFIQSFSGKDLLISSADALGSAFLYQKYLFDHFAAFNTKAKVEMPTSLAYEMEYILEGKDSDSDNLKSLIYNLLTFRTIMNTVSLFSDATSNKQAKAVATTLVGFLGMPILITITKTIILFAWGLAESLIDISAILREKSIAIYKEIKDFQLKLVELPFFNKRLISLKVESIKGKKSPLYLNYEDYLNILLLIKNKQLITFRTLDLIQINLQNNYEDSFLINNCIFGLQVNTDFSMDQKFVSLPFIKESVDHNSKRYLHNIKMEYSY